MPRKPDIAVDQARRVADAGQPLPADAAGIADPASRAPLVAGSYAFATGVAGSLVDMSSGTTTLIAANQDDSASAVALIGFDFYFQGVRQDRFSVNSNGTLRLGATAVSNTLYDPLGQAGQSLITAYGADQRTHTSGKVHSKVIGSAPNRTLVVEWLNMQSNFSTGGTADLSYQVQLSETTGAIGFVYGAMTMSAAGAADANSSSPQFGFSSGNTAGTIGTITAAQGGAPAPSFDGTPAAPVNNTYVAGAITVLTSAADGSRRTFAMTPPAVTPPGGPLSFSAVGVTGMTLNWTDSPDELGYAIHASTDGINYSFVNSAAQDATSFAATGLLGATNYLWRVYAVNEGNTAFIAGAQTTATPPTNTSLGSGLWSAPGTWSSGSVPSASDAVVIAAGHTVTIDTAAVAYTLTVAGNLQFEATTARTLTPTFDLTIAAGGTLMSNPAGTQIAHSVSIASNLINNGTLDLSTNADTAGAVLTFTGAGNSSFSGNGATTDVRQVVINKGTSAASMLEITTSAFSVRGSITDSVAGGWLTLTNGTLKLSGSFSGTSRVFGVAAYPIAATTGFWLNNPNYTVAGQNGSPTNSGLLRITQGTYNIGTSIGNSMGFASGSTTIVEGGAVNATGRFGVNSTTNTITYNQSAGTVTVCTIGNVSSTFASFDLGTSVTSSITLSGGTIVTQLANTGASTPIDYRNQAGSGITGVTGTTLQLGNAASGAAKTFNLRGVLPNVVVTNTSAGHTALMSTTLANYNNIARNISIASGATFNTNNVIFLMAGASLVNDGTLTANGASSNFVWFDVGTAVPQTYSGSGVTTSPITNTAFQNTVTLASTNQWISANIRLFTGSVINSNKLTLGTGGATASVVQIGNTTAPTAAGVFDAPFTFNLGSGGQTLTYLRTSTSRSTGPEVNPGRSVVNFTYDDNDPTHTLTLAGGNLTATGTTALTNGRVITGANTLVAGTTTRTTGYVDGNLRKAYAAAGSQTFEVGSANGYTPVLANVSAAPAFPADVTVSAVQTTAPGLQPASKAISRHWLVNAPGATVDLTFNYLDPTDIPGSVSEAALRVLRHGAAGAADYIDVPGQSLNAAGNSASVTGATISAPFEWTLGEAFADLSISKTDGVTSVAAGGTLTYTITAANAGTVGNPAATVVDNFPAGLSCSTTCTGAGGATCTAGPFAGNINDTVNLPAGGAVTYTAVCSVSGSGTLSNTATVSAGAIADPDNSNNSATDADTTIVTLADLAISKTDGVASATPGTSVTYTISATNLTGPAPATAVVADTFPGELSCTWTCATAGGASCSAAGAGNLNDAVNLPVGGVVVYTAICAISPAAPAGNLVNTATVTASGGITDPNLADNSATDTDVLTPSANLGITKTNGVSTSTPGLPTTYTLVASNAGPSNSPLVTVSDAFPPTLTGCSWTCTGSGASCGAGGLGNINDTFSMPAGSSATYTATCTIAPATTGTLANTASITGSVTDPTPGNNSATDSDTLVQSADLQITKTDGVTTAIPGSSVSYSITAANAGPSGNIAATVADTFPATLSCTWTCSGLGGASCPASGSGNINAPVNLPFNGAVNFVANCTILPSATGTLSNTATVSSAVDDPVPGNNSATDTDTLTPQADLAITKTNGVGSVQAAGNTTYAIVASNNGPSNATGTVADLLSPDLTCTWTCVGAGGGTCTAAGSGNINDAVNLPAGGSATYTLLCSVSAGASGTLANTATISSAVTDPNGGNNSATDSDPVTACGSTVVTNGNDSGAGSLRQILADACAGSTITFAPAVTTVTLTTAELLINKNLTIDGSPGVGVTRAVGSPAFRIFQISSGSIAALSRLTISNGSAADGGGVFNNGGTLTLNQSVVRANAATAAGGGGGGIYNLGELVAVDSAISDNTSAFLGGGIWNRRIGGAANASISNSIIANNRAASGAGIHNYDANLVAANTTVSGNEATIVDPTGGAAGIENTAQSFATNTTLTHCTFSDNRHTSSADPTADDVYSGNFGAPATVRLRNTLLGGSAATATPNLRVFQGGVIISHGNNLSTDAGAGLLNQPSDLTGANALLAPLGSYGGATQTRALLPGSPAINAGTAAEVQQVSVSGFSGSFTLSFNGQTTTALAFNSTAAQVQSALQALTTIGAGNVSVTQSGSVYTVTFAGSLGSANQTALLASGIGGASAIVSTLFEGGLASDQRGIARPQLGGVDIGAYESRGFTLAIASGNNQSTGIGLPFAAPLVVNVTPNAGGEPVNGGQVSFTPPGAGASASLSPNPVTIAAGAASTTATANGTVGGPYSVQAAALGGNSVNFSLTNVSLATTTTITSDAPDPSVVGQPYTVNVQVSSATLSPAGTVTVSDGSVSCGPVALLPGAAPNSTASCILTSTSAGAKTLTASYTPASGLFQASSGTAGHQVNPAATTISVSGPARSRINQPIAFSFVLGVTLPGAGTPTGTVTLQSGANSCTATLPATSCNLTFTSLGARTVTASYAGDGNFAASTSSGAGNAQTLVFALSDITVTKSDGRGTYAPGDLIVYSVLVRNLGPDAAANIRVRDNVPAGLAGVLWSCDASGGAVCPASSGSGNLDALVANMPSGGLLGYTFFGTVSGSPLQIANTALVELPADTTVEDPVPGNNSATDTDLLDALFRNGFENPAVAAPAGSFRLPGVLLRAALDEVAIAVYALDDADGVAAQVYARVWAGELQFALASRDSEGRLHLGAWRNHGDEPTLSWTAAEVSAGWRVQTVALH